MRDRRRAKVIAALVRTKTELQVRQPDAFCHVLGHLTPEAAGLLADAVLTALDAPEVRRRPSTGAYYIDGKKT